ncbi:hypothetical protein ACIBK8_16710 [Streptomyces sp. NPDC050161]|uniref:hypothetical protein n=1 Tax=Streptomyces sp. NPDC050161 TaxID=3365604 RepID=UPI0037893DC7
MRRLRIPVLLSVAVLAAGVATAAVAHDSGPDKQTPKHVAHDSGADKQTPKHDAAPKAAHPQVFGPAVNIPPGGNLLASVACPAGTVPTGGGGVTQGQRVFFTDSFVASTGQWSVRGTNTDTTTQFLRAFAICTTP